MIKDLTRDLDENEVLDKRGMIDKIQGQEKEDGGMRTTRRSIFEDDWVWLPQGARGREIYIGRGSLKRGVPRSKWANPFVIGVDGNRPGVINLFRDYARKTFSEKDLADIRGKCLVCHCRFHETCHGDVLADMAGNLAPTKESELLEDGLPLKTGVHVQRNEEDRARRTKQARKTWTEKQRRGEVGWDADPRDARRTWGSRGFTQTAEGFAPQDAGTLASEPFQR